MSRVVSPRRSAPLQESASVWRERSGRLYEELRRPARAMIRRAFRSTFGDEEIEDIYSNAWVGTLRALGGRHHELTDEEIRKYVLTAVANHAGKELRRRKRRPTAPLEAVHSMADNGVLPDEHATTREQSRITRDLLASLPPRRRAVMLLRYGWGLEPRQVCGLIKGLSPRAYRKEITRGVDELTEKLRLLEQGDWCADREPVLKAYAAGIADSEQHRQAQQHLSHCRHCCDFVGRLTGHLHDLGGSIAIPSAIDALHRDHLSLAARAGDLAHRMRESAADVLGGRPASGSEEGATQALSASGTARGAGAAGTGALAKLAGLGGAGKLAALCLGGGAAATVCVASGVIPASLPDLSSRAPAGRSGHPAIERAQRVVAPVPVRIPPRPADEITHGSGPAAAAPEPSEPREPVTTPAPAPPPAPIAPSAPPEQQEFGVESAAPTAADVGSSSSTGDGGGSAAQEEFGGP